MNIISKLQ
jgi:hypothetical protein